MFVRICMHVCLYICRWMLNEIPGLAPGYQGPYLAQSERTLATPQSAPGPRVQRPCSRSNRWVRREEVREEEKDGEKTTGIGISCLRVGQGEAGE